jgi:hypothetical protein
MNFKQITKREARKRFYTGTQPIYLCPCNMSPSSPWGVACLIFGKEYLERAKEYVPKPEGHWDSKTCTQVLAPSPVWSGNVEKTAWDLMYNNWAFYNANDKETGYYAHYYIQVA